LEICADAPAQVKSVHPRVFMLCCSDSGWGHCLLGIENFDHFLIEAYEQCGNQLCQLETEKRAGK
ncbi:MAG: hypothetical protein WCF41_22665, partial [Pseudolabrys sp.]